MSEMDGAALIAAERSRQITGEGWTAAHDDRHDTAGLARAGACYALHAAGVRSLGTHALGSAWPWPWSSADFKPDDENPVRTLVKAGALIAAEIDRLLRESPEPHSDTQPDPYIDAMAAEHVQEYDQAAS